MLKKFWNFLWDDSPCKNCELLRDLLQEERIAKEQLLVSLVQINRPKEQIQQTSKEEFEPILPKIKPWRVQREILEREDREKLKISKVEMKSDRPIEDIERSLGIWKEN